MPLSTHETALILASHERDAKKSWIEHVLAHYNLGSPEGLSLMCLAEALLRIPDDETAKALMADRLGAFGFLSNMPYSLTITRKVMKIMATQFVMAETIEDAVARAAQSNQLRYSFDMLGEAARTEAQANDYFDAYLLAIHTIGKASLGRGPVLSNGVSIKLSALYSRFELLQMESGFPVLYERLKTLVTCAKSYDIGITIDAEEADRLDYQLALFERLLQEEALATWSGLGIAVQAYQKRAHGVIKTIIAWIKKYDRHITVRLVKGAYWDTEIKRAQVLGLDDYPVFTKKSDTDDYYLTCAILLRANTDRIFSQFATHNAETLAAILDLYRGIPGMEIQRLFGMGEAMHAKAIALSGVSSRIYAPVGGYQNLLAYLVRRLIENGANSSFLNQIKNAKTPIDHDIPLPRDIFGDARMNSRSDDLGNLATLKHVESQVKAHCARMPWHAGSLLAKSSGQSPSTTQRFNPALRTECIAQVSYATPADLPDAFDAAEDAYHAWTKQPVSVRTAAIRRAADLLEENRFALYAILIKEAGKTLQNAVGEVREAIDFCRYYATQAELLMNEPVVLPGPTGESNQLTYRGRGVILCISPWNFPLSIFTGQIMAALAVGNAVIAKPAKQTSVIAHEAVKLFHAAGIPRAVLQLIVAESAVIGTALLKEPRVAGVIMTGSLDTARQINQTLAQKLGPIIPLIAETGGQNAMIVDSSALLEQVVVDVVQSAFDSAGQRCSALRVLFVQEEIAEPFMTLLKGAMDMLTVGDPRLMDTDLGPVIDAASLALLETHLSEMSEIAHWVHRGKSAQEKGFYFPPTACEIDSLDVLSREIFGPMLHVIQYRAKDLEKVIAAINQTGYGLTFGMESRIEGRYKAAAEAIEAGNAYVNRNMIGAVVGVQPFGGQGLSGTGPKAGGPHYLMRLVHERVLTVNTTAVGGNVDLLR